MRIQLEMVFRTHAYRGRMSASRLKVTRMAGEQSFKAVINDTRPSAKGRSFSVEITGSNFNHFWERRSVTP